MGEKFGWGCLIVGGFLFWAFVALILVGIGVVIGKVS